MADRRPEWWPVASWELLRMLTRVDFIVSVLIMPVLILGVGWFMTWIKQRGDREQVRIAVVGTASLDSIPRVTWVVPRPESSGTEALKGAVRRKEIDGAVVVPADYAVDGAIELVVRRPEPRWRGPLEEQLQGRARLARAGERGIGADVLDRVDAALTVQEHVADPNARSRRSDLLLALGMSMIMLTTIFTASSYMMIGISGEKQARVTEVVVSAIRPEAWMDGKLIAYTILGVITVVAWLASGLVMLAMFAQTLPASVNLGTLALSVLFGFLGIALFCALYGAMMATLKDIHSTSKAQGNLILIPFIPVFFVSAVIDSPDAGWIALLSMIPLFSPTLMPTRIALGGVPVWQIVLSLVLLVIAVQVMRVIAGKAFRLGMLMYGKDATLPEIVRWMREK